MNRTVHDWLQSVPDEKRKVFINSLFDVLAEHQVDTLQDLKEMSLTDMAKMIASLRKNNVFLYRIRYLYCGRRTMSVI